MLLEGVEEGDDIWAFGSVQNAGFAHGVVGSGHHGGCSDFQGHGLAIFWVFGLVDVRGDSVFPVVGVGVAADLSAVFW